MNLQIAFGPILYKLVKKHLGKSTRSSGFTGTMISKLSQWENPCYWIKKDFFRAAIETDLPPDLKFTDFQWPIPAGVIFLEKGALEVNGKPVGSITFAIVDKNVEPPTDGIVLVPLPNPEEPIHKFIACANIILPDKNQFYMSAASVNLDSTIDAACTPNTDTLNQEEALKSAIKEIDPLNWDNEEIYPLEISERNLAEELPRIISKINLALSSRPNLIQRAQREETKDDLKPAKETEELWSPNLIGADYRMQRTAETENEQESRKVRSHFRRGHFRNQAHGPNLSERKIIWIEPAIIGLKSKRRT